MQANLEDNYCWKLYYLLKDAYLAKKTNMCHFSNLSVNFEKCISWLG